MASNRSPFSTKRLTHTLLDMSAGEFDHVLVLCMHQREKPLVHLSVNTLGGRRHMSQHQVVSHQSAGSNAADAQYSKRQGFQPAWCAAVAGAY
jgi:hypothetical protein